MVDAWRQAMKVAGFASIVSDDLTGRFVAHFERLVTIARSHGSALYPEHETVAFEHGISPARRGVIGHSRFVGRLAARRR